MEAWQESYSTEIDSARRKLEHRLKRLEKKLERQSSVEWNELRHEKEAKELRAEYDRIFGRITDDCRAISEGQKEIKDEVKTEVRAAVEEGVSRLEKKLAQLSSGNSAQCSSCRENLNPVVVDDGMDCGLGVRVVGHVAVNRVRSRSSPVLGRTSGAQDISKMDGASPVLCKFVRLQLFPAAHAHYDV